MVLALKKTTEKTKRWRCTVATVPVNRMFTKFPYSKIKSMEEKEKTQIMSDTAQHLIDMVQKRLNNRFEALNALASSPMDNISDEIKKMREIEAGKIRAVMEEQKDLIDIMKVLFPKPPRAERTTAKKKSSVKKTDA